MEQLITIVANDLNESVGAAALEPLLGVDSVVELFGKLLLDPGSVSEQELVDAIEPYVGDLDAETPAADYARRIAIAARNSFWRAKTTDREAVILELRRQVAELADDRGLWAAPRLLNEEWIPRSALQRIKTLKGDEALRLEEALAGVEDRGRELAGLVAVPPRWVQEGTGDLWAMLGDLAAAYGDLQSSQTAFVEAAERGVPDRVRVLAKASQTAALRGDNDEADELLERARKIDAAHPEVAVAEARRLDEPEKQLAHLDGLEPADAIHRTSVEVLRAMAHLELGDAADAEVAARRALDANPDNLLARQLLPAAVLERNVRARLHEDVDRESLREAEDLFLELASELRETGRLAEASRLMAAASRCASTAGERIRAARHLEDVSEWFELDEHAPEALATAALEARRPDLVRGFLGDGEAELTRILRAKADMQLDDAPDVMTRVAEVAAELIQSTRSSVRAEAGLLRATAALRDGVEWSGEAVEAVREQDEQLAAMIEASKLASDGDLAAAREALSSHHHDPRVLELLVQIAAEEEDWPAALQMQRKLLAEARTIERRLDYARLLHRAGELQQAAVELDAIRVDARAPHDIRRAASGLAAAHAWDTRQFTRFDEITREWLEIDSESASAVWMRLYAHYRLGRFNDARALLDDKALRARDVFDARIVAQVVRRTAEPEEAVRRIAELSDQFDRSDDWLEGMVIISGLGRRAASLPPELRARRQEAHDQFQARFPDSKLIQTLEIPEDDEGMKAFLREHLEEGAAEVAELQRKVWRGELGATHLAASVGKEVATLWTRLDVLPLGLGNEVADDADRADALDAIDKPAIWDTSSLYVVGGLGPEVSDTALRHLPGSATTMAVLDDAARAADVLPQDDEGERFEMGWDPVADRPRASISAAEEVERQEIALAGILALAQQLVAADDLDPAMPGPLDNLLSESEDSTSDWSMLTLRATLAVAARLSLPVFSDDRFVRGAARAFGLKTFGTPALLEALVARGHLSTETGDKALRRLRVHPSHGLRPDADVVLAEGRSTGWKLTPVLAAALGDPTGWNRQQEAFDAWRRVLSAVHDEAPDEFDAWAVRIILSAHAARPEHGAGPPAIVLLALSWIYEGQAYVARLTRVIDNIFWEHGFWVGSNDVRTHTATFIANLLDGGPPVIQAHLLTRIVRVIDVPAQLELLGRFSFEKPDPPAPTPARPASGSAPKSRRRKTRKHK